MAGPVERLVVLPGMDGTGRLLRPFADALAGRVGVDLLAYPTQDPLTYLELADRLESSLPDEEPFVLLGESFGGPLALILAARARPNLRGLVLAVTFAARPRTPLLGLTKVLPVRWMLSQPIPCWAAGRIMLGVSPPAGALSSLCEVMDLVSPEVLAKRFDQVRDLPPPSRALTLPAIHIRATRDLLLPTNALDDVKAWVPNVQVHELDGPHLVLDTHASECAEIVARFIDGLNGSADALPSSSDPDPDRGPASH